MPDAAQILAAATVAIKAGAPATYDSSGYSTLAITTALSGVTDIPEVGRAYNVIPHQPVAQRGTSKFKGGYNDGQISITMARDDDDAGQIAALTGLGVDTPVSIKITYADATIDYFTGLVMSFNTIGGGQESIVQRVLVMELIEDIVTA